MILPVSGFSKLTKEEKINWLQKTYLSGSEEASATLRQYWNEDIVLQQLHEEFIENTISNFYMPFGIAPNFLINDYRYAIPMATEESSVIAAASKAAKFWGTRGGFRAEVIGTRKNGQIHFIYKGDPDKLEVFFDAIKPQFLEAVRPLVRNMEKRGGGITSIDLRNKTDLLEGYYQIDCGFETVDSMGANFINSCLERFADVLEDCAGKHDAFDPGEKDIEIIMSILSNYVPECLVRSEVSCPVEQLGDSEIDGPSFASRFIKALQIAELETFRAVTHNKGIMNGIDAVVLATGNDFRAVEAGVHAYACRDGRYSSLTHAEIRDGIFRFWIEIPLALGTVGGLTSLHPLSKTALEILQKPTARELMMIAATTGLAQNFAAVKSLITTGIQEGHMKMHLMNILNKFRATTKEKEQLATYFTEHQISYSAVAEQLEKIRS